MTNDSYRYVICSLPVLVRFKHKNDLLKGLFSGLVKNHCIDEKKKLNKAFCGSRASMAKSAKLPKVTSPSVGAEDYRPCFNHLSAWRKARSEIAFGVCPHPILLVMAEKSQCTMRIVQKGCT